MASVLKVDKLDPQSGTALEIGTSGDTITVPSGATLDISASTLTPPATMPASSGINFTALNATNLGSGTVPTARLGSGTASSSTVLYGDQTYKAEPGGGKVNQIVYANCVTAQTSTSIDSSWYDVTNPTVTITPSATDSKIYIHFTQQCNMEGHATDRSCHWEIRRSISGGASTDTLVGDTLSGDDALYTANTGTLVVGGANSTPLQVNRYIPLDIAWLDTTHATTSAITYGLRAKTYSATAGSYWFGSSGSNFPAIVWEILA